MLLAIKSHLVDLGVLSVNECAVAVDWEGVSVWLAESSAGVHSDMAPVVELRLGCTNFFHVSTKSLGVFTPFTWKNLENSDAVNVKLVSENPLGFPTVNLNWRPHI